MVVSVDILRERLLLRAEDGSTRIAMLQDLKDEVGSLEPKKPKEEVKPPSALVSFDEGNEKITTEEAVDAVTPGKRRRRWRRGRRRKRKNQNDESKPPGDDSKPGPESGHGG
jgi:hypothetical protein